jgi:hypothetical protein
MAAFKTRHFEVLAAVVNRYSIQFDKQLQAHNLPVNLASGILNSFIDELCYEFHNDNPLFNETLFRSQCGLWIEKSTVDAIREVQGNG